MLLLKVERGCKVIRHIVYGFEQWPKILRCLARQELQVVTPETLHPHQRHSLLLSIALDARLCHYGPFVYERWSIGNTSVCPTAPIGQHSHGSLLSFITGATTPHHQQAGTMTRP